MDDMNKYIPDECAVAILKSDTIRENLDNAIISDLENASLHIIWRKLMYFNENLVKYVYPDKINTATWEKAKYSLLSGPIMILLLNGYNVHSVLKYLKGNWDKGGIRSKYHRYSKKDLIDQGYSAKEVELRLGENKIHTCDFEIDSIILLSKCMSNYEKQYLETIKPYFSYKLYLYEHLLEQRRVKLIADEHLPSI